jgi:hypothetical protein
LVVHFGENNNNFALPRSHLLAEFDIFDAKSGGFERILCSPTPKNEANCPPERLAKAALVANNHECRSWPARRISCNHALGDVM